MNISDVLLLFREASTKSAIEKDVQGAVFISVLAIVGIVGNSILIDVYTHTRKRVLSTHFIIILGIIDLSICSIIMPMRVTFFFFPAPPALCSIYLAMAYVSVSCSIYLFLLIAIDRYQAICRLGEPLIMVKHLKFLLANMFFSNIFICVIAPLYLQGDVEIVDGNRSVSLLMRDNYPCYVNSMLNHPDRQWDSRYILHFILAMLFTVYMLGVSGLYVQVFKALKQIDAFRTRSRSTVHPEPTDVKLEARPCNVNLFHVFPRNFNFTIVNSNKNSSEHEVKIDHEKNNDKINIRAQIRASEKESRCKCSDNKKTANIITIANADDLVIESNCDGIDLSNSKAELKDFGDDTKYIAALRAAYELPIHPMHSANHVDLETNNYTSCDNKTEMGKAVISISDFTKDDNHEDRQIRSDEKLDGSNRIHFQKAASSTTTKRETKRMRFKRHKSKSSKRDDMDEPSATLHSINTITEEIITPPSQDSKKNENPDSMKVWATKQSSRMPGVAAISVKLKPSQMFDHFRDANQNHSTHSRIKKSHSHSLSKAGSSHDENAMNSSDKNSKIPQTQTVLSRKILLRLFLVTLFYCLCWLPFYLIELGVVPYDSISYQTFFMANMVNPLIHLTTSKPFRQEFCNRLRILSKRRFPCILLGR